MKMQDYQELATFLQKNELNTNSNSIFFRGFGQLHALLYNPAEPEQWPAHLEPYRSIVSDIYDLIFDRYNGTSRQVIDGLKRASVSSYFTPTEIIKAITESIDFTKISNVLDPCAGTGNFLKFIPEQVEITALEPDILSYGILCKLYPEIQIQNKALQAAKLDRYDLILSNIPFGSIKVFDPAFFDSRDKLKITSTTRIHNYFFVKALDHLNDDGIVAFITSSAFTDSPGNQAIREYLIQNSTVLAFARLPGEIFQEAGTKPTTDLIVLQKRSNKAPSEKDKLFLRSGTIEIKEIKVPCNSLLINQPDLVIGTPNTKGQYGNDQFSVSCDNPLSDIAGRLKEILRKQFEEPSNFDSSSITKASTLKPFVDTALRVTAEDLQGRFHTGNLFVRDNSVYRIQKDHLGFYLELLKGVKATDRLMRIINMRILYNMVLHGEQSDHQDTEDNRAQLNSHYDAFYFQFGNLNDTVNSKIIKQDAQAHLLLSLENRKGTLYSKSDIFSKRITNEKKIIQAPKTLSDAIIYSLNAHNRINIQTLENLLGQKSSEIIYQGVSEDLIYLDKVDGCWIPVTKDYLVSGDIYNKIKNIKESFPDEYFDLKDQHLQLVTESLPIRIPFELIDINLGERWIQDNLYNEFLTHFFKVKTHLIYLRSSDKYEIQLEKVSPISDIDFAVRGKTETVRGKDLMQHAFNDTIPSITYPIHDHEGNLKRVPDNAAIRNAQNKIEQIYQQFQNWITNHTKWEATVEEEYNRLFNASVPRCYDGSHLRFEGLSFFKPYGTQKNAVYRNLQQNGGINDHKVGAGKTLVMAISACEMKRLGVANKPLIIAKNANVSAIYSEIILAYPNSKILHPEPKDFKPVNRRLLFQRIMNNDWDCVIISHEQFKMIPQSRQIQRIIIQQEIDALESDLKTLEEENDSYSTTRQLKGLEKRKENLEANLEALEASIIRDPYLLDFEKMGFDHLFVDESQEFKNLLYTTRHSQVSGLGSPRGSQRAFNLLLACRTIQRRYGNTDKGITFLSGTTISNSLVELYLLFKYLRPNELERLHIRSFDAWAKVYARKSFEFEFGITNEIKRKERYREFIKVPELARFYTEITDVVNDKNFTVDKPSIKNHIVNLSPTPSQSAYMNNLIQFAKTKNGVFIGKPFMTKNEERAYMLIATNLAKKMSLDMRLIDPQNEFEEGSKVDLCSKRVAEIYHDSTPYKGTQLIFCDLSTPNTEKWNVYDELRHLLHHKYQIPLREIAFIHEAKNPKQKDKIKSLFNQGDIRVLIGSTIKLGVGNNVQERVVAMHHLDIPWRPSDFEQRTGRGGRPGNLMAKLHNDNVVDNYVYAVERSLDSYQFNLLSSKQKFINQIKDNSIKLRRIDEGSIAGEGSDQQINFAEYVALLSGNTHLLEKIKIDKKLKDLEIQYSNFISEQSTAKWNIERYNTIITKENQLIEKFQMDIEARTSFEMDPDQVIQRDKRYSYPKPVTLNGHKLYDSKEVGCALLECLDTHSEDFVDDTIGHYGPFKIGKSFNTGRVTITGPGGIGYTYSNGYPNENPTLAGAYIKNALDKHASLTVTSQKRIASLTEDIKHFDRKLTSDFDKKELIHSLKAEAKRLDKLIEEESEKVAA